MLFSVREYRLNYANNENILCNHGLTWQSSESNALNHCVGSSNTSTQIQRILSKLAPFTVTGITSTHYCRIQNFRLRTLGVPVSTSNSQEASRNSLRSSKLELKNFYRDACVWQLKCLHWEFQCNFASFENILKIPLTPIKQTCSTRSIWRDRVRIWCGVW